MSHLSDSMSSRNLSKLETKPWQNCFLCFQYLTFESEQTFDSSTHSISYICQYLNISYDNISDIDERRGKHKCHNRIAPNPVIPVKLCSTCTIITAKLSSLIKQLEITQMLIDHQFQEFYTTIQEKTTEDTDPKTIISNSLLRHKLLQKCKLEINRIKITSPKVKLERVTFAPDTLAANSSRNSDLEEGFTEESESDLSDFHENVSSGKEEPTWVPDQTTEDDTTSEDDEQIDFEVPLPRKKSGPLPNLQKLLSKPVTEYFEIVPPSNNKCFKCLICQANVKMHKGSTGVVTLLTLHLLQSHIDKFFEHLKIKNITNEQFAVCCKHVLLSQISRGRQLSKDTRVHCPHCVNFTARLQHLRRHLVRAHFSFMEREIKKLQQSKDLDKLSHAEMPRVRKTEPRDCENWQCFNKTCKKFYKYTKPNKKQFQCLLCLESYNGNNPRGHLVKVHPETLFNAQGTFEVTEKEQFHKLCMYVIISEVKQAKRVKSPLKTETAFKCQFCQKLFQDEKGFRYHLASKHFRSLEAKLKNLQNSNFDLRNISKKSLANRNKPIRPNVDIHQRVYKICSQFFETANSANQVKCSLCNNHFSAYFIKTHFVSKHAQKLFEEMKLENVSDANFKFCCNKMLSGHAAKSKSVKVGAEIVYKCQYCNTTGFQFRHRLKYHLVLYHFEIMEEILVRLQTDRIWEDEISENRTRVYRKQKRKAVDCKNDKETDSESNNESEFELRSEKLIKIEECLDQDNETNNSEERIVKVEIREADE